MFLSILRRLFAVILLTVLAANFVLAASGSERLEGFDYRAIVDDYGFKFSDGKMTAGQIQDIFGSFDDGQSRIRVIISLAIKDEEAFKLYRDTGEVNEIEDMIAVCQLALKADIGSAGFEVTRFYKNSPSIAAKVTESSLSTLLNHPLVDSVTASKKVSLHLRQGTPLIKADFYRPAYNGSNTSIAILDTGVDYEHIYLGGGGFPNSKVIGGYDFIDADNDPKGYVKAHGTACAGVCAGVKGNFGDYIGGVASGAKIYALRVMDDDGSGWDSDTISAIDWCVSHRDDDPANPIKVISISLGGEEGYSGECDSKFNSYYNAVQSAVNAGIAVVASSGNSTYSNQLNMPACLSNVVSVGAVYDEDIGSAGFLSCTDSNTYAGKIACYTNLGSNLDLLAPAHDTYTLDIIGGAGYTNGDFYTEFGGTSAACPYVAGVIACLQQAAKEIGGAFLPPADALETIKNSGDFTYSPRAGMSFSLVDLKAAIDQTAADAGMTISPSGRSHSSESATGDISVTINAGWSASADASWITINSGYTGSGSGVISYSVEENQGNSRTGVITVSSGSLSRDFVVDQTGNPYISLTMNLHSGWNWISFNVLPQGGLLEDTLADFTDNFSSNGDYIVAQNGKNATCWNGTWYGTLEGLLPGKMYKLRCENDAAIEVTGEYTDPSTPVSISAGWTWMGYTPTAETTPFEDIAANLSAVNGDYIVIQNGKNATSWDGKWYGTLTDTNFQSGKGVLIRMENEQVFQYQN